MRLILETLPTTAPSFPRVFPLYCRASGRFPVTEVAWCIHRCLSINTCALKTTNINGQVKLGSSNLSQLREQKQKKQLRSLIGFPRDATQKYLSHLFHFKHTNSLARARSHTRTLKPRNPGVRAQTPDLRLQIKSIISRGCRRNGNKAKY